LQHGVRPPLPWSLHESPRFIAQSLAAAWRPAGAMVPLKSPARSPATTLRRFPGWRTTSRSKSSKYRPSTLSSSDTGCHACEPHRVTSRNRARPVALLLPRF
jgi:hypothetical protein